MTGFETLMALFVSALCLSYLCHSDTKRRRVYGLPEWGTTRYLKQAWLISVLPGLVLLFMGSYAALIMWLAAYSLLGWCIALIKPRMRSRFHPL
jgi:hypothetical protein